MKLGFVLREAFRGLSRNFAMTIALVITTAISRFWPPVSW